MTEERQKLRSRRDRAYNLYFRKKGGELSDFSGGALVAAGLGGGIVAKLAPMGKTPALIASRCEGYSALSRRPNQFIRSRKSLDSGPIASASTH